MVTVNSMSRLHTIVVLQIAMASMLQLSNAQPGVQEGLPKSAAAP
jgi:hypothetical protein